MVRVKKTRQNKMLELRLIQSESKMPRFLLMHVVGFNRMRQENAGAKKRN